MAKATTLIFDFDGTLADTFGIALEVFRGIAPKSQATDDKTVEKLRSLPAKEALWAVGVRWWNLPYIVYRGRKAVKQHMDSVNAIKGMPAVLQELHEQGYKMYILSSNSTKNIRNFLDRNKLNEYFTAFWGGEGVFAKAGAIRKVVHENELDMDACIYIGDEVRDVDAAKHAGMRFIGVTWGYNNRKALENAQAESLVDKPKDLLKSIVQ
jgi:phosphoglycolate phosphatase